MNEPANIKSMFSDTIVDALRVFPGAKVVALNKPLFCNHCDKDLIREYERLCQSASVAELVALLKKRRGGIVGRTWPSGGRDWCCHACGRGAAMKMIGRRLPAPTPLSRFWIRWQRGRKDGDANLRRTLVSVCPDKRRQVDHEGVAGQARLDARREILSCARASASGFDWQ